MTTPGAPPDQLEQTLGRLVDAGIHSPAELAGLLGLESRHIGRPLHVLTLAGVLESDAAGVLHITPAGRAWLGAERAVEQPPSRPHTISEGPRLEPLGIDEPAGIEAEPRLVAPDLRADSDRSVLPPRRGYPANPFLFFWFLRKASATHRRRCVWPWRLPRVPVALPRIGVAVGGVELSAPAGRRIAAVGAAGFVLLMGVQAGVRAWGIGAVAPVSSAAAAQPATAVAAPIATRAPVAAPPERWVVVQHTHGLGLVLRPSPASASRVLTLQEGARVRVTGDPVQQDGRQWLPVASLSGKTGWVAGEFVDPAP